LNARPGQASAMASNGSQAMKSSLFAAGNRILFPPVLKMVEPPVYLLLEKPGFSDSPKPTTDRPNMRENHLSHSKSPLSSLLLNTLMH